MSSTEVSFFSGGETVRGDLYLPEGKGPFPAVVLAGGWCYVKELRQPRYAEAFAAKGIAAQAWPTLLPNPRVPPPPPLPKAMRPSAVVR
jgi:dienelactone hydrolase